MQTNPRAPVTSHRLLGALVIGALLLVAAILWGPIPGAPDGSSHAGIADGANDQRSETAEPEVGARSELAVESNAPDDRARIDADGAPNERDTVDSDEAPTGSPLTLRFVGSTTGEGLPRPRVTLLGCGPTDQHHTGDEAGVVRCTVPEELRSGGVIAIASADDHCRRLLALHPSPTETVVALMPAGSLEIRLLDEAGGPVEGVEVQLLPPARDGLAWPETWTMFSGRWFRFGPKETADWARARFSRSGLVAATEARFARSAPGALDLELEGRFDRTFDGVFRDALDPEAWSRKTDAEGIARWSGLPAVDGYQWALRTGTALSFEPPAPARSSSNGGGRIVIDSTGPATDVSGPFEVPAGGEVRLTGTVARRTGVTGSIPLDDPTSSSEYVVTLFHRSDPHETRTQRYAPTTLEEQEPTTAEGTFLFEGIQPGEKLVQAWWRDANGSVRFAGTEFHLPEGVLLDLGPIAATRGVGIDVQVRLVDPAGTELDPGEYFDLDQGGAIDLTITALDAAPSGSFSIGEILPVQIGEHQRIEGLPPGEYWISLGWIMSSPMQLRNDTRFELPDGVFIDLLETSSITLDLRATQVVAQTIDAVFPGNVEPVRCEAYLYRPEQERRITVDLRVQSGNESSRGTLQVEAGTYDVLVHSQTLEESPRTGSWVAALSEVTIEAGTLVVHMEPGATLQGVALESDGTPIADRVLRFTGHEQPPESRPQGPWTHMVRTGSQGEFTLVGLEPGKRYTSHLGPSFVAGAAGGIEEAELRRGQ